MGIRRRAQPEAALGAAGYFAIDRRLRENPFAALVVDRYDEDWSRLAWVMVRSRAEILPDGPEHDQAQTTLRARYPQLAPMRIDHLPVVAIRIDHAMSWGRLDPE